MRIIGFMVCGPNEADRYLENTLKEFKRLCDDALIVCNNTDEKTEKLIRSYNYEIIRDDREWGIYQPQIKGDGLKRLQDKNPDWVIALDADEVFAPEFTREEAEKLMEQDELAYYFMIVNLYNDEEHFAHSAGVQRFWNIRFYQYAPQYGLQFQKKNVHCGLAPPIMYKYGWYAPFYVSHYGLMKPEDRMLKVERYQKYDPNGRFKGGEYYSDLRKELKMLYFDRKQLLKKMAELPECRPRKRPKVMATKTPKDFVYIERFKKENGKTVSFGSVDIPEDKVEETLRKNPMWKVLHKAGDEPKKKTRKKKDEQPKVEKASL